MKEEHTKPPKERTYWETLLDLEELSKDGNFRIYRPEVKS